MLRKEFHLKPEVGSGDIIERYWGASCVLHLELRHFVYDFKHEELGFFTAASKFADLWKKEITVIVRFKGFEGDCEGAIWPSFT